MEKRLLLGLTAAAAGALALTIANPANAATTLVFDQEGDSYTVDFDGYGGTPPSVIAGLTGQVTYTLADIDGANWTFDYSVHNNSTVTASRISIIGFDVDPNQTGVGGLTGFYTRYGLNGNVPNHGDAEVCLRNGGPASGASNCAGGGGTGVLKNGTNGGSFTLTFADDDLAKVELSNLVIRYQSIDGVTGVSSAIGRPGAVPEPATWALMIMGFGSAGAMLRRRRTVAA